MEKIIKLTKEMYGLLTDSYLEGEVSVETFKNITSVHCASIIKLKKMKGKGHSFSDFGVKKMERSLEKIKGLDITKKKKEDQ